MHINDKPPGQQGYKKMFEIMLSGDKSSLFHFHSPEFESESQLPVANHSATFFRHGQWLLVLCSPSQSLSLSLSLSPPLFLSLSLSLHSASRFLRFRCAKNMKIACCFCGLHSFGSYSQNTGEK